MKYVVVHPIRRSGKRIEPGTQVNMTEADAAALVAVGALLLDSGAADAKAAADIKTAADAKKAEDAKTAEDAKGGDQQRGFDGGSKD